jgi:hypothetical protein
MGRSKRQWKIIAAALALVLAGTGAARAECLAYGGAAMLDGWASLKQATAAQIAAGMAKGSHWSIKLAKPICMAADATGAAITGVPRVAFTAGADQDQALRAAFGKRVQVSGLLRAVAPAKVGEPVALEGAVLVK